MGLQTDNANVSTHSYAISKKIKPELPDWSQTKDLSKSYLTVYDFDYFFENIVWQFAIQKCGFFLVEQ